MLNVFVQIIPLNQLHKPAKLCDKVVVIILCALNFLLKDQARTPFPLCVFRKRYLRIITNATSVSSVRRFHPTF